MSARKVAFGLITRNIDNPTPVLNFLENAWKHDHEIDRIIIAYSHGISEDAVNRLRRDIRVDVIHAAGDPRLCHRLEERGLAPDDVAALLDVPSWAESREVPYGAYRTAVLVWALISEMDDLLFFDTDVYPRVLIRNEGGVPVFREIDFVGRHLAHLSQSEITVTSSDYSGYYIIPPIKIQNLETLLYGLCKELAYDYICNCAKHKCLNLGPENPGPPHRTAKALGGNCGISLDFPQRLGPFFSTTYRYDGMCVLGRGEDTLLGPTVIAQGGTMLDIDLRVFHDTYGDFPHIPSITEESVRERFYRACLGWIGRNPFLTWFRGEHDLLAGEFDEVMAQQREDLAEGGKAAARDLHDARFARLPEAFDRALKTLPAMIERHERLMQGWRALVG